jgi:hypothetical protein
LQEEALELRREERRQCTKMRRASDDEAKELLERERWIRVQQFLAPSGFQKLDADSNFALVGRSSSATWRRRASK